MGRKQATKRPAQGQGRVEAFKDQMEMDDSDHVCSLEAEDLSGRLNEWPKESSIFCGIMIKLEGASVSRMMLMMSP